MDSQHPTLALDEVLQPEPIVLEPSMVELVPDTGSRAADRAGVDSDRRDPGRAAGADVEAVTDKASAASTNAHTRIGTESVDAAADTSLGVLKVAVLPGAVGQSGTGAVQDPRG